MQQDNDKKIKLDGKEITLEEFQQSKGNLKKTQRLVETAPNNYEVIERMFG